MNYSLLLKNELIAGAPQKRACCKRAYAAGLLYDLRELRENCLVLVLTAVNARAECVRVYREQYRREALLNGSVMLFASEKLYGTYKKEPAFVCEQCRAHFLRGLLITNGSATDPKKGYQLELRMANAEKIDFLSTFLKEMGWPPKCRNLDGGVGLYYKKSAVIEEILSTVGATNALFTLINEKIERDMRNATNRSTNLETSNLSRTVDAGDRVRAAIDTIKEHSRFETMPDELQETAMLRAEHLEASLSVLAQMHNPPITKSGLNHRLKKIIAFAEELEK